MTQLSGMALCVLMLKELKHHHHYNFLVLSDTDSIIEDCWECLVKMSGGLQADVVCMTRESKDRGKISYTALRNANIIMANIHRFIKYIYGSMDDIDKEIDLMNLLCANRFNFIIVNNAFQITDNKKLCDNLFEVWESDGFCGWLVCVSKCENDNNQRLIDDVVHTFWMKRFQ